MKKTLFTSLILVSVVLLFSCNKPDEEQNNTDTIPEYDKILDDYAIFDNNSMRVFEDTLKNIYDTVVYYDTYKEYNNNKLEKIYVYYNSSFYGVNQSYIIGKFYENDDTYEILGKSVYFNNLNDTTLREYGRLTDLISNYTINNLEFIDVKRFEYFNQLDDNAICYWAKGVGIVERTQYRETDTLHWLIKDYVNH